MYGLIHQSFVKRVVKMESVVISGVELKIQSDEKLGCFIEILERTKEQMDAMLSHHSRLLVIRLDLRTNDYMPNNETFSKFIRKLRKKLKHYYTLKRVGYVWVREQETSKHQHYHMALLLDGNKVCFSNKVHDIAEQIWHGWDLGSIWRPKHPYYRVHRDSVKEYQDVFYRVSYLAKERGKGYKAKTANDYSCSRIKPK